MEVAEGLEWVNIYWVKGPLPKMEHKNDVRDPPCSGQQNAFLMRGQRRSTLLCPFSLEAYTVKNDCAEVVLAQEPSSFDREYIVALMMRKWEEYQTYGFQRGYDSAAVVFKLLGAPVPVQINKEGEEDMRTKGGKPTADKLLKPVKRTSKRGKFLEWFLADGGGAKSVRECMAVFDMTRSNALSYLFILNKDHGIGYSLIGDNAEVELPDGGGHPFGVDLAKELASGTDEVDLDAALGLDDDDWLC